MARANSQRIIPHTERTAWAEFGFYHLGLSSAELNIKMDLVIADRSGEEYRSVMDDVSVSSSFVEIHRADTLSILVDGYKIIDPRERHSLKTHTEMILQGLLDGEALSYCKRLAIVLTKLDEIECLENISAKERALSDFDALVTSVKRRFGSTFLTIQPFKVAASPKSIVLNKGYGLSELLSFWIQPSSITEQFVYQTPVPRRAMGKVTVPVEEE